MYKILVALMQKFRRCWTEPSLSSPGDWQGFFWWISSCVPTPGHWAKTQGTALISEGWEDLTQIHSRDGKAGGQLQRTDQLSALISCVQFNAFHHWQGTIQVTVSLMLKITSAGTAWACVQGSAPHTRQELNIEPQFNSVGVWEPRESPVSSLCSSKMWGWQAEPAGGCCQNLLMAAGFY